MKRKKLQTLKGFNLKQWLVLAAFVLVLCFTGFYIFRSVESTIYWREHRDEQIRGWMTIGYVAHSYHVPPRVLYEALNLPPDAHDKRPLREIAKDRNRSLEEIRNTLEQAVETERSAHALPNTGGSPRE